MPEPLAKSIESKMNEEIQRHPAESFPARKPLFRPVDKLRLTANVIHALLPRKKNKQLSCTNAEIAKMHELSR